MKVQKSPLARSGNGYPTHSLQCPGSCWTEPTKLRQPRDRAPVIGRSTDSTMCAALIYGVGMIAVLYLFYLFLH